MDICANPRESCHQLVISKRVLIYFITIITNTSISLPFEPNEAKIRPKRQFWSHLQHYIRPFVAIESLFEIHFLVVFDVFNDSNYFYFSCLSQHK